eukprot:512004-Pelagomonas_calceolata.AAC.1
MRCTWPVDCVLPVLRADAPATAVSLLLMCGPGAAAGAARPEVVAALVGLLRAVPAGPSAADCDVGGLFLVLASGWGAEPLALLLLGSRVLLLLLGCEVLPDCCRVASRRACMPGGRVRDRCRC